MKKEYDFPKGVRGKFYRPDAEFSISVYLEPDVAEIVRKRALKNKSSMEAVVNELLRKDIGGKNQPSKRGSR